MAGVDEGIRNLDMKRSWLSDHPLVSNIVEIPYGDGQILRVKMGVFRLATLSNSASDIGINAEFVGEGEGQFLNRTEYQNLLRKLIDPKIQNIQTPRNEIIKRKHIRKR